MNRILSPVLIIAFLVAIACGSPKSADDSGFHTLTIESPEDLKEFFAYSPDRIPFVSAK